MPERKITKYYGEFIKTIKILCSFPCDTYSRAAGKSAENHIYY